jgi:hypothetical protein
MALCPHARQIAKPLRPAKVSFGFILGLLRMEKPEMNTPLARETSHGEATPFKALFGQHAELWAMSSISWRSASHKPIANGFSTPPTTPSSSTSHCKPPSRSRGYFWPSTSTHCVPKNTVLGSTAVVQLPVTKVAAEGRSVSANGWRCSSLLKRWCGEDNELYWRPPHIIAMLEPLSWATPSASVLLTT